MRHVRRGGSYLRVADPAWEDPLSGDYARNRGGRWNPPGSFGVIYLNATVPVARAQVRDKLGVRGIQPEDLEADQGPTLVHTTVPETEYVDAVTDAGLAALGLPETYPLDDHGVPVEPEVCQPIGRSAWDAGEGGIACRSAAESAPAGSEELAYFARRSLHADAIEDFADWYW